MTCYNIVECYVPLEHFVNCRKVSLRCGLTNPWGHRAVCETCQRDPAAVAEIERQEESIEADNAWLRSAGWGEM
jgi:hypothetical protein